jgi:quinoprotein dehydrogenase-associated probable ABC transporter substrate-binding protein
MGAVPGAAQVRPELVSSDRLRVCADPANLPFSNKARAGFENKIAEIVADELKLPLHYYWMPQGPGFVRNTLGSDLCDVIIGYAIDADLVDHTIPYYASTYALVTRPDSPLAGVDHLDDARLKASRLGVIAATPPVDHLLRLGLTEQAKTYALLVDRRFSSPAEEALADLAAGAIDAAILWGPIAGYFAQQAATPLRVTPLRDKSRPPLAFAIGFGVRPNEPLWKHRLNAVIDKRRNDIEAVLKSFSAPLVPTDALPQNTAKTSAPQEAQ